MAVNNSPYGPEEMKIPGAYPEYDRDDIAMQALNCVSDTWSNVIQTGDATGTQISAEEIGKACVEQGAGTCLSSEEEESNNTTSRPTHKIKDELQDDNTTVNNRRATMPASSTIRNAPPDDVLPLSRSFENMKISGQPTTLPSTLQDEYYRYAMTHNIEDDPLDLNVINAVPRSCGEARSFGDRDRDRDCVRGGDLPGDGPEPVDHRGYGEEGDVDVGYGGVTYNRSGYGGVLPGYPTPEGMSKLIFDRMRDDQLRLAGAQNPASASCWNFGRHVRACAMCLTPFP